MKEEVLYTRAELEECVRQWILLGQWPPSPEGMTIYQIRGVYVSQAVVAQCADELLERMVTP